MSELTRRYAKSFLEKGGKESELKSANEILTSDSELWEAIISPAVSAEEKQRILHRVTGLPESKTLMGFLNLLAGKDHMKLLEQISRDVHFSEMKKQHGAEATLTCVREPTAQQLEAITKKICEMHNLDKIELNIKKDPSLLGGFMLELGGVTYDRSARGALREIAQNAEEKLDHTKIAPEEIVAILKEEIEGYQNKTRTDERGTVLEAGDGIATIYGLGKAAYGELLKFDTGVEGMVMDLKRDSLGCVLLGSEDGLHEGSVVLRTGQPAAVPVGENLLGRVIDALGNAIDGLGSIDTTETRPIERVASGVITREPVNEPMQTGILAIDAMVPIGRGQRELIVGDRQTGKTAIAVDTILNQKGQGVICIYVAIGQKASSVANVYDTLQKHGAMDHSIIVSATASDPAPLQYIAPYAGAAIGEYFMEKGKDVLIIFDDLSKHAVAYRTLSLLLKRSPGREAYPGDVFYLHSRLLERACRLTKEYGGGSMTALPIIETLAGDVSAYIPTNVISITDGQIYLENDLFFAGQRPAVNVGLSVSRVGGAAQKKAIKKTAGTLRIDLARFRELEIFTQFASDLDNATKQTLEHGKRLLELLKQPLYHPMSVSRQAILLYIATSGLLDDVPIERIKDFSDGFIERMLTEHGDVTDEIQNTGELSGVAIETIRRTLEGYKKERG
ncbi:MAG: F0F1 ATP synthase subunit alpha [Oscillospiraceae bacterium]